MSGYGLGREGVCKRVWPVVMKALATTLAVGALVAADGRILAQPAPPVQIEVFDGTSSVFINPPGTDIGGGLYTYQGLQSGGNGWTLDWAFQFNPDPHYTTFEGTVFHFQGLGVFFSPSRPRKTSGY